MKVLYMVFKLDNGKNMTLRLPNPKTNITRAMVEPVMQGILDAQFFQTAAGAEPLAIAEAYVKETTDTTII